MIEEITENSKCGPFIIKKKQDGSVILELAFEGNEEYYVTYDDKLRLFLTPELAEELGELLFIQW